MKEFKMCPHHMLNAFYISYFIWKIKPTLYCCVVSSLSRSHFSLWINYQNTNFVIDFLAQSGRWIVLGLSQRSAKYGLPGQIRSTICFYTAVTSGCFVCLKKILSILFHNLWELCQVPKSIYLWTRLFLDSLWRLEWQGEVITQTVWPAKPKIVTIWPVTEKLDDPLFKWIVIDLSLAFPGLSPAGIAHVTMKCKQRSARGVLERLCILPKRLASYLLLQVLNRKVKSEGESFYLATMGWWT